MPAFRARQTLLGPLLAAPVLLGLAGCGDSYGLLSYPPQARGNQVDPDQLKQLVPGTSTSKDVTALLGSPTAKASFADNTWIYVTQITKPVIAGTQSVEAQRVYALTFDGGGVLRNIESRNQDDALPFTMVSRTTPSPGSNASFLQQLLGNIGRFNPVSSPGAGTTPSGTNTPGNF